MQLLTKAILRSDELNFDSNNIPYCVDIVDLSPRNVSLEQSPKDISKSNLELNAFWKLHVPLNEMWEET